MRDNGFQFFCRVVYISSQAFTEFKRIHYLNANDKAINKAMQENLLLQRRLRH